MASRLAKRIERVGDRHGVADTTAVDNGRGCVFVSPSHYEWPDAMLAEVEAFAERRRNADSYYWVERK